MKAVFILLVLLGMYQLSSAQQQEGTGISADTLRYHQGRIFLQKKSLRFREYQPLLLNYRASAAEYRKYNKKAMISSLILITGVTSGVIAMARSGKEEPFFNPYTNVLFGSLLVGIPISLSAKKHLKRSVRLYNSDLLQGY